MGEKAKRRLSRIRPREVSLVDTPTNEEEALVVKRQQEQAAKDGEGGSPSVETPVAKRLALAVYKLSFSKYEFPEKEDVTAFFKAQGVDSSEFKVTDNDWEWNYEINDKSVFEGSSLGSNWIRFNVGVDGVVGVLKNLSEAGVEKKGAKVSAARLKQLKKIRKMLDEFLVEFDEGGTEVSKQNTQAADNANADKTVDEKIAEVEKRFEAKLAEKDEKIAELQKSLDAKDKPAETTAAAASTESTTEAAAPAATTETPAAEAPAATQETDVSKRLTEIEKRFDDKLKEKDDKIADLEKRLKGMEEDPGEPASGATDETTVEKGGEKSFWSGVL